MSKDQHQVKIRSDNVPGDGINSLKHMYFHQLNSRKLSVVLNLAVSEGLQLYSQIKNLIITNGALNAISSRFQMHLLAY
jgi:hypothetical protein